MLRRPLLTALIAGMVSATGFAPLDWWPVTIACIALLLWLVHQAPSLRRALLRGWVFGLGHFTVGDNWIQHAFDYQDKMPPVLGYGAVALVALYLAIYPALAMGLAWRFGRDGEEPGPAYVLVAAAAWIGTEWLRATLFTGYPWNPLGVIWVPVAGMPWLAAWIGTYALSGVTVLVAGAFVARARPGTYNFTIVTATLAVILLGWATDRGPQVAANAPLVRVVQPDIGQDGVEERGYAERVLAKLIALSGVPGDRPRLVVWPEGMVNQYIEDGYPQAWYWRGDPRLIRARIAAVLGPRDMGLISGTALFFGRDGKVSGAGNAAWPIDPAGTLGPRYDKAHLVPYGEYLPMRGLLAPLGLARLVMGDVDFVPGPGPRTLALPGFGKVGVQICYEMIFSGQVVDRANRPDLLFNPSNDAWFGSWGPPEHLAQARLRAIEEGLPVLRATPTGVSAVIDADGRVLASLPLGAEGAIEVPIPSPHPPTLFAKLGNWLALIAAGLLVALAIAFRRRAV